MKRTTTAGKRGLIGRIDSSREFLVLTALTLVITAAFSYFIYQEIYNSLLSGLRYDLTTSVRTAATSIDGDKHWQLQQTRDDQSALYKELKEVLKTIKSTDDRIGNVYTMATTGKQGVWQFVVDAEEDPEWISHLGDEYDVSEYPEMQESFNGATTDDEPSTDEWGTWLSGYAPVYTSSGRAVAIVGIDLSADDVNTTLSRQFRIFLIPLAIVFALPVILSWLLSKHTQRKAGAKQTSDIPAPEETNSDGDLEAAA